MSSLGLEGLPGRYERTGFDQTEEGRGVRSGRHGGWAQGGLWKPERGACTAGPRREGGPVSAAPVLQRCGRRHRERVPAGRGDGPSLLRGGRSFWNVPAGAGAGPQRRGLCGTQGRLGNPAAVAWGPQVTPAPRTAAFGEAGDKPAPEDARTASGLGAGRGPRFPGEKAARAACVRTPAPARPGSTRRRKEMGCTGQARVPPPTPVTSHDLPSVSSRVVAPLGRRGPLGRDKGWPPPRDDRPLPPPLPCGAGARER